MNTVRRSHGATLVDGTIIVCGGEIHCYNVTHYNELIGRTTDLVIISSCEQSNVGVTSWAAIASLPVAVMQLKMVTLNNKAYAIGGYQAPTSVLMYDGVSVWIAKSAMTPGRYAHTVLALDNDRALVCGGLMSTAATSTCTIYTATTDSWSTAPAMAQTRNWFNLVMLESMLHRYTRLNVVADIIYAIGNETNVTNSIEAYSTTTGGTLLSYSLATEAQYGIAVAIGITVC
jgi:hypothetical protein